MTDRQANGTVTQPNRQFYQMRSELRLWPRELPYPATIRGMGSFLSPCEGTKIVYANRAYDRMRFNEPNNLYGMYIASLTLEEIRLQKEGKSTRVPPSPVKTSKKKTSNAIQNVNETGAEDAETPDTPSKHGGRPSEFIPFKCIMKESANELAERGNYVEPNLTERRLQFYWKIQTGFATEGNRNAILDQILLKYVKIRLGFIQCNLDEFRAALRAVSMVYIDLTKDMKVELKYVVWTLPGVHYLNGHMLHLEMTPIAFHQDGERDNQVASEERAAHNLIKYNEKKNTYCVESRPSVIHQYQSFAIQMGFDAHQLPKCAGPPEANPEEPAAKKTKRTLEL